MNFIVNLGLTAVALGLAALLGGREYVNTGLLLIIIFRTLVQDDHLTLLAQYVVRNRR